MVQGSLAGCSTLDNVVVYLNDKTHLTIIRVPRASWQLVWGALNLITTFESARLTFSAIHVGGTIRSCQQRFASSHHRLVDLGLQAALESEVSD